MNEKLVISSSPHIRGPQTVSSIMRDVVFALMPACIASIIFFGMQALVVIAASVISAVVSSLYEKAVKRPVTINDFSAVITGILLALTLPPGVPVWIPVIGSASPLLSQNRFLEALGVISSTLPWLPGLFFWLHGPCILQGLADTSDF